MTSQTPRRGRRVHNGDNRGICPTERARRAARGGGARRPLASSLPRAHASCRASRLQVPRVGAHRRRGRRGDARAARREGGARERDGRRGRLMSPDFSCELYYIHVECTSRMQAITVWLSYRNPMFFGVARCRPRRRRPLAVPVLLRRRCRPRLPAAVAPAEGEEECTAHLREPVGPRGHRDSAASVCGSDGGGAADAGATLCNDAWPAACRHTAAAADGHSGYDDTILSIVGASSVGDARARYGKDEHDDGDDASCAGVAARRPPHRRRVAPGLVSAC